jgi:hypothetical protein
MRLQGALVGQVAKTNVNGYIGCVDTYHGPTYGYSTAALTFFRFVGGTLFEVASHVSIPVLGGGAEPAFVQFECKAVNSLDNLSVKLSYRYKTAYPLNMPDSGSNWSAWTLYYTDLVSGGAIASNGDWGFGVMSKYALGNTSISADDLDFDYFTLNKVAT